MFNHNTQVIDMVQSTVAEWVEELAFSEVLCVLLVCECTSVLASSL